jgi:hypothetical protein
MGLIKPPITQEQNSALTDSKNILKWSSTALFIAAGLLLALNIPDTSKYGFLLFLTGHVVLLHAFIKAKDTPMITQNAFFLIIDLIGIYKWFF